MGESAVSYAADSSVTAHIALRLAGQRWSQPSRVVHRRAASCAVVRTPCPSGDVELSVECVANERGTISVKIGCSHWLIDQAGLGVTCVRGGGGDATCVVSRVL